MSLGLVQGKATHIVWPPGRWQRLENFIPEGRLTSHRDHTFPESKTVRDASNSLEKGTKREGLTCSNSSWSRNVPDDPSSVKEIMYGPIS